MNGLVGFATIKVRLSCFYQKPFIICRPRGYNVRARVAMWRLVVHVVSVMCHTENFDFAHLQLLQKSNKSQTQFISSQRDRYIEQCFELSESQKNMVYINNYAQNGTFQAINSILV